MKPEFVTEHSSSYGRNGSCATLHSLHSFNYLFHCWRLLFHFTLFQNCIPIKNSDMSPRLIKMTNFLSKTLGRGVVTQGATEKH